MIEGVECLIVAEAIQKWSYQQDVNKVGFIDINLEDVYDSAILRYSIIPFNKWNTYLKKFEYKKISTFGKTIFLPFGDYRLAVQLGMNGTFSEYKTNYSRIRFCSDFSSLYYNDMRKFGNIMLYNKHYPQRNISNLLKHSIDWRNEKAPELFAKRVIKRKKWINSEIKYSLMNQQLIAGIGNVYACEGLLAAKVHPRKKVKDIDQCKLQTIIVECQKVMNESYKAGGMNVYDFTFSGKKGFRKKHLKAYDKQGIICRQCNGSIIQRTLQKLESTYYCPVCQK